MANPNPAGALASSAGTRTTLVEQLRATLPAAATPGRVGAALTDGLPPSLDSSVFVGLVVAIGALAYWYRRIL
jgi:hypothetical protein